jgi:hypothetical protein
MSHAYSSSAPVAVRYSQVLGFNLDHELQAEKSEREDHAYWIQIAQI